MNWYYAKNGAQQGPIALEDLKSRIVRGEVDPSDLAWREGMADWLPVSSIAELKPDPVPPRHEPSVPTHVPAAAPAPEPYRGPQSQQYPAAPAAYQQGGQPPAQGMAIASLICGIVSLVACCLWFGTLPLGLIAIVLGFIASGKAKSDPARYTGKGMARAGIITGFLGLIASAAMGYFALQFKDLTPEQAQEKVINMFPISEEQKNEIRREIEKEQQKQRPSAP